MTETVSLPRVPAGIPYAECHVSPEAQHEALQVMRGGWLTTGATTARFEAELAAWIGTRESVAVSSCTAAIELALRAMDLPPGSAVLTPSVTFCGAVHAILHAGLRPVLLDLDDATLTVSREEVQRAAEGERRNGTGPFALVVQHMAGYPAATAELAEAAGLPIDRVVEDAAHALGAERAGRPVGTLGSTSCFSFYATKNLPIGEGGALTTRNPERADRLRVLRQHGMTRDAWRRYETEASWRYDVDEPGLKANFTDLQAAIGIGQLGHLSQWQARRAAIAGRYDEQLREIPGITLPPRPRDGRHAWHLYVVRVGQEYGRSRDELSATLAERGIGTSVHFIPVHRFSYFRRLLGDLRTSLPVAERVGDELLSLPLHPHLSDDAVDLVCAQLASLQRCSRR
ncbi:MAG: DegT/DnrJ/EryC1/StrS family aminotransferase [Nocardioides sp.]